LSFHRFYRIFEQNRTLVERMRVTESAGDFRAEREQELPLVLFWLGTVARVRNSWGSVITTYMSGRQGFDCRKFSNSKEVLCLLAGHCQDVACINRNLWTVDVLNNTYVFFPQIQVFIQDLTQITNDIRRAETAATATSVMS